jgi:sigma-B regulation protein RsbU (phosphoserine phosphatase)
MTSVVDGFIRNQLVERRHKLQHAVAEPGPRARLQGLLEEVDAALARIDDGSYGICESCHDSIEADRLICNPLTRFCLDHLTLLEREALQQDLELAARVQKGLLPPADLDIHGWRVAYHYEPAGLVSGDYCDIVDGGKAGLYFMVGDVSGKGIAASMLMSQLHAMFRTLISVGLPLQNMLQHASRVFSQSTLPAHYATLVCGRADPNGRVEICNAGHVPPLLVCDDQVTALGVSDLPVGMFLNEEFSIDELLLRCGHSIVLYSDGVSEASDSSGTEYGRDRLRTLIAGQNGRGPSALVSACRDDLVSFCAGAPRADDVTMLVLNRAAA